MVLKPSRAVFRTRCYECGTRITYNDLQDPDEVIAAHLRHECEQRDRDLRED
jgi:hypothetical protein